MSLGRPAAKRKQLISHRSRIRLAHPGRRLGRAPACGGGQVHQLVAGTRSTRPQAMSFGVVDASGEGILLTSAHLQSCPTFRSPPHGWPQCFTQNLALKTFLKKTLRGSRCRLTAKAPDSAMATAAAAGIDLHNASAATIRNTEPRTLGLSCCLLTRSALRPCVWEDDALGWPVLHGFAVFEVEEQPGVYAARPSSCV